MDLQSRVDGKPPYQIIESDEFKQQFELLVPHPQLRDDILLAFHSELPVDPEKFEIVPSTNLRAATVVCNPPLTLYFTVQERVITLVEIHPFA